MGTRPTPIEVATGFGHGPSRGPSQTSNLTSALQTTSGNEARLSSAMDIGSQQKNGGSGIGGSGTSYSGTAAQPISVNSSNRDKPRRESLAGSMVTGMSWGGNSVGSWIRDDIIMQGTSPFASFQSPSFHSASYLPKLEANFMRDFNCCGLTLATLHDLLQHYEETHSDQVPPHNGSNHNSTQPDAKAARAAEAASNIQKQGGTQQKPSQINTSTKRQASPQRSSSPATPKQSQPQRQLAAGFAPTASSSSNDDETVGNMEMDDDYNNVPPAIPQAQYPIQSQTRPHFGQPASSRVPPLDMNTLNMGKPLQQQHQGLRNSQPTTPISAVRNGNFYHNNPTVSSVNTPTLSTYNNNHPLQQQYYTPESSAPGTPAELDPDLIGELNGMNMGNLQYPRHSMYGYPYDNGHDMLELCIDEPAKRLFTLNGGNFIDPSHSQRPTAASSNSQLGDAQYSENSEIARTIREEQKRAGVPDPSVEGGVRKPFHCPVIGCEKAYKNHNGLKYHKQHGHNKQKLSANKNGTFSIVDPETLAPYPGTLGMEKQKPFRCDDCGKRYKNLNGLKYHKGHEPECKSVIRMPGSKRDSGMSQTDEMVM